MDDRELDTEVAEKVMKDCAHVLTFLSESPREFICKKCGLRGFNYQTDYEGRVCVAHYSTEIAEAFQVVEKLREQNIWAEIYCFPATDRPMQVEFLTVREVRGKSECDSFEKLPEAICRAALKAVER